MKMSYDSTDPLFQILSNSPWWKVSDMQAFFKQIRKVDSDFGLRIINEDWRETYFKDSYKFNQTAPFTEGGDFKKDKDNTLYICESVEGWGAALSKMRAGFLIKDDYSAYVEIMKAVNAMEAKLVRLEGVYDRDKFNKEFSRISQSSSNE